MFYNQLLHCDIPLDLEVRIEYKLDKQNRADILNIGKDKSIGNKVTEVYIKIITN